jgi:hypothetical protein
VDLSYNAFFHSLTHKHIFLSVASDKTIVKIPSRQIAHQRVTNMSRVRKSQVKQVPRFNYADIDKIPKLVNEIKIAMKRDFAEELIADGTRPFHVHWTDMEHDHLQLQCDFRFDAPPIGTAAMDRKQRVLMTLAKVVKENGKRQNIHYSARSDGWHKTPPRLTIHLFCHRFGVCIA